MKLKTKPNHVRIIDDEATGAMVREEREKLHLTITDVAASAKYDVSHLSMLERGKRSWSQITMERVSEALRVLAKNGKAGK